MVIERNEEVSVTHVIRGSIVNHRLDLEGGVLKLNNVTDGIYESDIRNGEIETCVPPHIIECFIATDQVIEDLGYEPSSACPIIGCCKILDAKLPTSAYFSQTILRRSDGSVLIMGAKAIVLRRGDVLQGGGIGYFQNKPTHPDAL